MKDAQGPIYEGEKKQFVEFQTVLLNPLRAKDRVSQVSNA